jgi:hypothetical protein
MPAAEVFTFAGIDVSGRELSVARRHGQGDDKPAMAKFPKSSPPIRRCGVALLSPREPRQGRSARLTQGSHVQRRMHAVG